MCYPNIGIPYKDNASSGAHPFIFQMSVSVAKNLHIGKLERTVKSLFGRIVAFLIDVFDNAADRYLRCHCTSDMAAHTIANYEEVSIWCSQLNSKVILLRFTHITNITIGEYFFIIP